MQEELHKDYIFGVRAVIEAVKAQKSINKIMIQKGMDKDLFYELKDALADQKYNLQFVPKVKLDRITRKNHQGVIAFMSPVTYYKIEDLMPIWMDEGKNPLVLVLDRVTDVRNFGAIARNAECLGVNAIVIPSKGSATIGSDAVKTSSGALMQIKVCMEEDLTSALEFMKNSGCVLTAATEKGAINCYDADFTTPIALIMGSEEDGVSDEYLNLCHQKVKIPMTGNIDSLNVSVATGILLYEVERQRGNS